MRARAVVLVLAALVLAGCGSSGKSVLAKTAENLDSIHSGTLDAKLLVTPRGGFGGRPFGFDLHGPFALKNGALPVTRMDYTQHASGKDATVTLVSDGHAGYVTVDGTSYFLPADRLAPLQAVSVLTGQRGSLRIDRWIHDAKVSDGGTVGGADTDHVHASLDVPAMLSDVGVLALGGRSLTEDQQKQLERATRSATIDVYTGKKDRLLRRLQMNVDLGFDVPPDLRTALGRLVGARMRVDLGIANPNRPVSVAAPKNALPYSQLAG